MTIVALPEHATGQDTRTALEYLGAAGVTAELLTAAGVDTTAPGALRVEVEALLGAALAEDTLADKRHARILQDALLALYTDAERAECDRLAADMASFLGGLYPSAE